jgi:Ca-activated chloride channel family protein
MIDLNLVVLASGLAAVMVATWALAARSRRARQDAEAFGVGGAHGDAGDASLAQAPARPAQAEARALPGTPPPGRSGGPAAEGRREAARARIRTRLPRVGMRALVRVGALLLLSVAAAAPRWPGIPEPSAAERTLVVVLDVSMSMRAGDVAPSRLDEARRQIQSGVGAVPAGRLALVAFAAEPVLVCPPTTDRVAFADLLSATGEDVAPAGPSHASLGLLRALALVEAAPGDIVLVSDGDFAEEDRDRLREVVRLARTQGARISTLAVGTASGAVVPRRNGAPGEAGLDDNGQPMVSRLDAPLLAWLAGEGGGESLQLQPGGQVDLVAVTERVRLAGDRTPSHLRPFGPVSLFGYPLLGAVVLLAADAWWSWRGRRVPAVAAAALVLAATLVPAPARAQSDVAAIRRGNGALTEGRAADAVTEYRRALAISPESAIARANLGTALCAVGQVGPAVEALAAAIDGLGDPGHRASAQYNLGNALTRLGRYDDALASYRASLRLRDDEAARFNYALVWRLRAAQGSTGPSPEPPMEPQRLQELRDKARALDVPVVRRPADARQVTDDR